MEDRGWRRRVGAILHPLSSILVFVLIIGCDRRDKSDTSASKTVVVYTSVDEPVARPILDEFQKRTGITVSVQTDTEANKSAGLAARLLAERDRPRVDVWWGNEVFHTVNLADAGALAPYESPSARDIPDTFKDPKHRWAGSGMRARVIAVRAQASSSPKGFRNLTGLEGLTDPSLKGLIAMARPTAGTTGGHVAALYVLWGKEKANAYFRALRANDVKLLGGNAVVAEQVGRGPLWAGLTDNDDVAAMQREGGNVRLILPDQETFGTLTIPCTVALVAGARNPEPAKKLIDHLLSPETERRLIDAKFARYSVRAASGKGAAGEDAIKAMDVDYAAVARALPRAVESAMTIMDGRDGNE